MKKNIFLMAAASAIMLTACTSEDDILQTGQLKQVAPQEVGFDVYTPAATNMTRAGLEGTMTTNRLQRSDAQGGGFGVYAFLIEDKEDDANATGYQPADLEPTPPAAFEANKPNFMVNEKVLWNNTNLGWYYNPLKYWPNETDNDSQSTKAEMENGTTQHLDRLTFFAYAPYVSAGVTTEPGITAITENTGLLSSGSAKISDPTIGYEAANSDNLDKGVDLLWGVAPAGGLTYTAVNGNTVTKKEGFPLIDMVKPDVNTSMKFLFNHALARIGVTVVAAVDQVSPGGKLDPNTKITIKSLKLTGPFGITGELNLNNGTHANVANWTKIQGDDISSTTDAISTSQELSITAGTDKGIAPHLQYSGTHTTTGPYVKQNVVGVTTTKQDLIAPSKNWFNKLASKPTYNPSKIYYTAEDGATPVEAATHTATAADVTNKYYKKTSATPDYYTLVTASTDNIAAPAYPHFDTEWYTLEETGEYLQSGSDPGKTTGYYTKDVSGVYTYVSTAITWGPGGSETYYTVKATPVSVSEIINNNDAENGFTYPGTVFYEAERNYFMVVPTNNILAQNSTLSKGDAKEVALRTFTVEITYYVTTEDAKVKTERTEIQNVITKKVVFPSLENGKSYNLNLVLGLTSVKMEAEVDDWKVINVQGDLPQNTAE